MTPGTPAGPTTCEGALIGSQPWKRYHCNGCAETASLRERLATAEAERAEWQESAVGYAAALGNRQQAHEAALADAAALRERAEKAETEVETVTRQYRALLDQDEADHFAYEAMKTKALAIAAEQDAELEGARRLLGEYSLSHLVPADPENGEPEPWEMCPHCGDPIEGCDKDEGCWGARARAFLAPTEPDGASGNRQGDDK